MIVQPRPKMSRRRIELLRSARIRLPSVARYVVLRSRLNDPASIWRSPAEHTDSASDAETAAARSPVADTAGIAAATPF